METYITISLSREQVLDLCRSNRVKEMAPVISFIEKEAIKQGLIEEFLPYKED